VLPLLLKERLGARMEAGLGETDENLVPDPPIPHPGSSLKA
jgi:hypothetical protein